MRAASERQRRCGGGAIPRRSSTAKPSAATLASATSAACVAACITAHRRSCRSGDISTTRAPQRSMSPTISAPRGPRRPVPTTATAWPSKPSEGANMGLRDRCSQGGAAAAKR
ncbi:MAG: hypothetical protein QM820_26725 [Minicystis sp.]